MTYAVILSVQRTINIETSEQKYVGFNKMPRTGVVMELNNNNVNTSEQDCVDITHVNRLAVVCIDSSEDEGDSLDFDTINNPDASCTVRGVQGGESVGMYSKLGKKFSSFVKNSPVNMLECQSVVQSSPMNKNVNQPDKHCNWNTRMATVANNELLANSKGVFTRAGFHSDHAQTDKYSLELQTTLKGGKCV